MTFDLIETQFCEVCGNLDLKPVLNLGLHPLCDDLVESSDNRICNEFPIEVLHCVLCNTAHQRFQVPKELLFPSSYHYRSRFTADVLKGMAGLVKAVEHRFGSLQGKQVLDIGCNDGSLLDFFEESGAVCVGIEPTDAYLDARCKGHRVYHDYLSFDVVDQVIKENGRPDFITFTNVFAHIENLTEVLQLVDRLTDKTSVIVIENHYLGSVLLGNQFDTFYHEHPRTYSVGSFVQMAKSLNLDLIDVEFPERYGGNVRVFLGAKSERKSNVGQDLYTSKEQYFLEQFATMQVNVDRWKFQKRRLIEKYFRKYGKIPAKAFPGRAAILIKLLGLNEEIISAVYEKPGSMKIGHYLPGTRIKIVSDLELFSNINNNLPILNLAWHIPDEIESYLRENGYNGEIIDVVHADDFI
ncbi:class I SAM-dependent methyltransferase [Alphaproteobacteria bacterium]|nr:class I SAM-dependent methyltransferase [Alphaproteobacteria bacterium]